MGSSSSHTVKNVYTNKGIIDSKNTGVIGWPKKLVDGSLNTGNVILNATGKPIRVYYGGDKMRSEDIVAEAGKHGKVSGSKTDGTKVVFNANFPGGYICIPADHCFIFSGEGINYACVFLESDSCSDECLKTIAENYNIPHNKSFIVTENHNIKLQKDGGSFGEDEDGIKHIQAK